MPLREHIKEILKKYGSTATAILLAVGTTIGLSLTLFQKVSRMWQMVLVMAFRRLEKKSKHSARSCCYCQRQVRLSVFLAKMLGC